MCRGGVASRGRDVGDPAVRAHQAVQKFDGPGGRRGRRGVAIRVEEAVAKGCHSEGVVWVPVKRGQGQRPGLGVRGTLLEAYGSSTRFASSHETRVLGITTGIATAFAPTTRVRLVHALCTATMIARQDHLVCAHLLPKSFCPNNDINDS